MSKDIRIIDFIPFGHKNAISRPILCQRVGLSDRKVRQMIENESTAEHPILNLQDGAGYFQPLDEDMSLVRMFRKQEYDRASSIMKRVRAVDKFYKNVTGEDCKKKKEKEPSELEKSQISMFDYVSGINDG